MSTLNSIRLKDGTVVPIHDWKEKDIRRQLDSSGFLEFYVSPYEEWIVIGLHVVLFGEVGHDVELHVHFGYKEALVARTGRFVLRDPADRPEPLRTPLHAPGGAQVRVRGPANAEVIFYALVKEPS